MPNPLFNAIFGGGGQSVADRRTSPSMPPNNANMGMQDAMSQLRADPAGMIRMAGYSVPDELIGNPQATVMHLLRSGQVGGPAMQRIQPMLNMLMRK